MELDWRDTGARRGAHGAQWSESGDGQSALLVSAVVTSDLFPVRLIRSSHLLMQYLLGVASCGGMWSGRGLGRLAVVGHHLVEVMAKRLEFERVDGSVGSSHLREELIENLLSTHVSFLS